MLILAFILVLILQNLSELTAVTLFISFAPGGVTEMSLIALSVASSPALVSAHHIFRIITTVSLLGIIYNRWIDNEQRCPILIIETDGFNIFNDKEKFYHIENKILDKI